MKCRFNLSSLDWILTGTHPYYWKLDEQMNTGKIIQFSNPPIKANVPGSVQKALLDSGVINDWNYGLNSNGIEWIENRHWIYQTNLPGEFFSNKERKYILNCLGLDGEGEIWLNGNKVGTFGSAFISYKFDIKPYINTDNNILSIIFYSPEKYQGQVYWTSKTKLIKPRFYYNWDWCPRLVQIGIWDNIYIESLDDFDLSTLLTFTDVDLKLKKGLIFFKDLFWNNSCRLHVILKDLTNNILVDTILDNDLSKGYFLSINNILLWNPNGKGKQYLYSLECELIDNKNNILDRVIRKIGFRKIEWNSCKKHSSDSLSWLCKINGEPVFLQGFNWTPVKVMFADVTEEEYRSLLLKYRDLGVNILRIWGGGFLEKECFYNLCDELGILVWQEFPLSSSGIDNTPSDDSNIILRMKDIVECYIRKRHYHTSLFMWGGGNELYTKDNRAPLDFTHPMLIEIKRTVECLDNFHRLVPASPSGFAIYNDKSFYGDGIMGDVHGPWWLPEEPSDDEMSNIKKYWSESDALFHSEVGVPGASSISLFKKYYPEEYLSDVGPYNPIWTRFLWWLEDEHFLKSNPGLKSISLEKYIEWSQKRQEKGLSIALAEAKKRFPACGGFIIWMGHDCFPTPANTSIIDFDGEYKPVAYILKSIMCNNV